MKLALDSGACELYVACHMQTKLKCTTAAAAVTEKEGEE